MSPRSKIASSRALFSLALLCCALLADAGCGARFGSGRAPEAIEALRKRAERRPNDKEVWEELAIAEHVEDGGEPKRAREALAKAKQLGARSLALSFVEAEEHVLEGRSEAALAAYLKLLEESAQSKDERRHLYAEAAIAALGDMNDAVDDYRARTESALEKLAPRASALGLSAAHQLHMARFGFAMLHGDTAKVAQIAQSAGCVQQGEVAGPFGPRELLGFDQHYPAEQKGPLAKSYDLGAGRGVQPTRKLDTKRCVLAVGRGIRKAWPGTSIVRSEVTVQKAGAHALRIESPNTLVVWVDGREIHRADLRTKIVAGVRYVPVELSAGKHELKVKLSTRHPNPALSLALLPAREEEVEATVLPKPESSLERMLVAKLALSRGDAVSARELLRKSGQGAPTAHLLVLEAATALADPLRSPELRRDLSRELLRRAARQNPDAWYPVVGIANLAGSEGRLKESIEALREAVKKWPEVIAIRTSLIEQLRERGFIEEAEATVRELAQRMPNACAVVGIELNAARARGRIHEIEKLTERAMKCDASSTARVGLLRTQRKYDDAAAEYLRLYALGDVLDEAQVLEAEIEHAELAGDKPKLQKLREQRATRFPDRPEAVLDRADLLVAEGKQKEAVSYLAKSIAQYPDVSGLPQERRRDHPRLRGGRAQVRPAAGAGARLHGRAHVRGRLERGAHAQHHAHAEPGGRGRKRRVRGARGRTPAQAAHGQGRRHTARAGGHRGQVHAVAAQPECG
jgi:tetratricopeptide (TPR) repeat protein